RTTYEGIDENNGSCFELAIARSLPVRLRSHCLSVKLVQLALPYPLFAIRRLGSSDLHHFPDHSFLRHETDLRKSTVAGVIKSMPDFATCRAYAQHRPDLGRLLWRRTLVGRRALVARDVRETITDSPYILVGKASLNPSSLN